MMMTVMFIRYRHVTDGALRPKKRTHLTARKRMADARLLYKTLQITAIHKRSQAKWSPMLPCCFCSSGSLGPRQGVWAPKGMPGTKMAVEGGRCHLNKSSTACGKVWKLLFRLICVPS